MTGAAGAPASLANAEIAFNEIDSTLYYGKGDDGSGQSTSRIAIGGSGAFQPLDADLTTIAALTGTNVIYYRSAANTWAAVTIGAGLSFSSGILSATGGGGTGNVSNVGTPTNGQLAQWTDATHIQGIAASSLGFESTANKGVANGYASLDATAKVPAAQLPSYVDDVVEYANLAAFPATGSVGIIYVALDTGKIYRWSGSAYVEISPSPGSTDAVPEGATNLYFTNERVDDRTAALIQNGTGITWSYNDAAGTLTPTVTAGAGPFQPLDGDLTSLAAASSVAIYYRSGTDAWSAVTIGTGLSFTAGTLDAPTFTSGAKGEVPASGGGTTNFLRADGTWAAPPAGGGGGIPEPGSDGFYGRNMASGTGSWVTAVKKAGDTMTGALTVLPGAGTEGVLISSAAGQARLIAAGSAADVGFFITGKGVASHYFYTNSFANVQVSIVHQTQASALMLAGGDGSVTPYNIYKNTGDNVRTQTPPPGSNDTSIATTAFVAAAVAAAGGGGGGFGPPQGRLTLQTGVPVMTTTQSAQPAIYYTPYVGNMVPIYDGTNMVMTAFSEISVATTDTTKNPAAIGASKVNDWFIWNDAGTLRLTHGPDWTNDLTRSAGTALVMVNGILLNNAAITNGPAAQRGTFVGTTRSDSLSQLDWMLGGTGAGGASLLLSVWNAYNRVDVTSNSVDSADHAVSVSTFTAAGTPNTSIRFVSGLTEDHFDAVYITHSYSNAAGFAAASVGLDAVAVGTQSWAPINESGGHLTRYGAAALGAHQVHPMERCSSGSATFTGSGGGGVNAGLWFKFRM